jgi:hypothetical protein
MKLAINLTLSFGMLALCLWLVWPDATTRTQLEAALRALEWTSFAPYLAGYIGLLVVVQLTRSLRWRYLLAPLGVRIPTAPLLAISSVGFMAILALPARLGELVRPALIRRKGHISASAALGTVAAELADRIPGCRVRLAVDGSVDGFERYEDAIAAHSAEPLGEEALGDFMNYSSGTTGRPKGIKRPLGGLTFDQPSMLGALIGQLYGVDADIRMHQQAGHLTVVALRRSAGVEEHPR